MPKRSLWLCLVVLTLGLTGCKGAQSEDIGDKTTREEETRAKMQNVLATDPSLKGPGGNANAPVTSHAAPPGAPMGSVHR